MAELLTIGETMATFTPGYPGCLLYTSLWQCAPGALYWMNLRRCLIQMEEKKYWMQYTS